MKQHMLLFLLLPMVSFGMQDLQESRNSCTDLREYKVCVMHTSNGFAVIDQSGKHHVQNCFVDKELRNRTPEQIFGYLKNNNYLTVNRMSDGEYVIHGQGRLLGGGLLGAHAGAWLGKALVSVVGHGAIALVSGAVSLVATPAAGFVVFTSLESTLGASIEVASFTGAIAGGIIGGVATGPV